MNSSRPVGQRPGSGRLLKATTPQRSSRWGHVGLCYVFHYTGENLERELGRRLDDKRWRLWMTIRGLRDTHQDGVTWDGAALTSS